MLCKVLRRGSGGARLEAVLVREVLATFWLRSRRWKEHVDTKMALSDGLDSDSSGLFFKLWAQWLRAVFGTARSRH